MPYLDELRESLRLQGGDIIMEDWYDDLVAYLESIEKSGAIDYSGYIHSDLIPDQDALRNMGLPNKRMKDIYSVNVDAENINASVGNFSVNVYVNGKRVLKDEDPIHIASFFDYAKDQITQSIKDALLNLGIPSTPKLLGYQIDYQAPSMSDLFASNLVAQWDGKIRVKIIGNNDFYAYMKFKPNVAPIEIIAWLNDGQPIKANTWKEMDFTVNKGDEINVQVSPSTRITILIYNIPQA